MKCQSLFSRKKEKNISKCRLLKVLPSMQSVCIDISDTYCQRVLVQGINSNLACHLYHTHRIKK